MTKFAEHLEGFIQQSGMPVRRVANRSGIPHQTLFNWLKGTQPRWHPALEQDLHRLGVVLGLTGDEIAFLLQLAGCISARSSLFGFQEDWMENTYRIPKGWFITGDAPDKYEIGVDPTVTHTSRPCVTIKAGPEPSEFGALAQTIKADAYHGKRLQFSAALRSEDIENRAALFMRVGSANGKILAFDNMRNRFISGTNDWQHHAVILDVAKDAEDIIFGLLLSLGGQVWMGDVQLQEVSMDVPTTDLLEEIAPYFPANLDFTE